MKHLKMFGLVLAAAAAVLAFGAAGTATATVLCKNSLNTEKCSEPYSSGTETKTTLKTGTSLLVKGPFGETIDTCTQSSTTAKSTNSGGATETVKSTLTSLSFTGCTHPSEVPSLGTSEMHWIAGTDNGTVTTTGTTVVLKEIPLFGTCQYTTASTDMGIWTGGNPGSLDLNAQLKSENGCPAVTLSGTYVATSPTAIWVTSG